MWKLAYGEASEISSVTSLQTDQQTHFLVAKMALSTLFCDIHLTKLKTTRKRKLFIYMEEKTLIQFVFVKNVISLKSYILLGEHQQKTFATLTDFGHY